MNAGISEIKRAATLGLGMQNLEIPVQRKFDLAIGSYSLNAGVKILTEMYSSRPYLLIDPKMLPHPQTTITVRPV